jgi:hypothetical protein
VFKNAIVPGFVKYSFRDTETSLQTQSKDFKSGERRAVTRPTIVCDRHHTRTLASPVVANGKKWDGPSTHPSDEPT